MRGSGILKVQDDVAGLRQKRHFIFLASAGLRLRVGGGAFDQEKFYLLP
jgi:hypothetical protein